MILPHKQGRWRLGIQNRPEAWAGSQVSPGLEAQQPQASAIASCHPKRCGIAHKQSASAQLPNGQQPCGANGWAEERRSGGLAWLSGLKDERSLR